MGVQPILSPLAKRLERRTAVTASRPSTMPLPGTGVTASASSIVARPDAGSVAAAADEKERSTLSKSSTPVCGLAGAGNQAATDHRGFKKIIPATPDLDLGTWP